MVRPSSRPALVALVVAALLALLVGVVDAPALAAPPADDTFAINDVAQAEGNAATTDFTFTVTRSGSLSGTVTVDYATAPGTATAPGDYAVASGTLTFGNGVSSQTITVAVTGDTTHEVNETFFVNLTNPSAGTISDPQGRGTITDDDTGPSIGISSPTVTESDTGTVDANFVITLSAASGRTITATATTSNGTATAGTDYATKTEDFTFAPGETTKTFTVLVSGDTLDEIDETFSGFISRATNVSAVQPAGTATITDNDPAPTISIGDASIVEGDAGTTALTFTVALSSTSARTVTFEYATTPGSATASFDYATTTGTNFIDAGTTTKTISINVVGDTLDEPDETFNVVLANPGNATIGDGTGVGTILDDDSPTPSVTVNDVTANEGDGPGTTAFTFTISLSSASSSPVSVDVATALGTADSADFTAILTTTVTIPANTTSKTVTVQVAGDTKDELTETFFLDLSNANGGAITDARGLGTIIDDDPPPTISIGDSTLIEGDSGTKAMTFTVTLSGVSSQNVTFSYGTSPGTATGSIDYATTTGTTFIAAGETSTTVTVNVVGDSVDEANETFSVVLSSPTNAGLADATGVGTIEDDDDPPPPATTTTTTTTPTGGSGTTGPAQGYSLVGEDGGLYAFGTAKNVGDMKGKVLNAPIIGVAYTPGGNGYWLVAKDGGIFTFGDADFYGSMGDKKLNAPVIGMAATPTGRGYWLFAGDGGIFTFGDAEFFGSMGDKKLNAPVINMESIESGNGYWLVAADGGIFTFGQAEFFGSMGDQKLNQPVFDMTSTDTDDGYWLVARDGGIFSFGDAEAKFYGSAVNETPRPTRVIGMDSTPGSLGYWIADASGKIYEYGNAQDLGDRFGAANPAPMIGFASVPGLKI